MLHKISIENLSTCVLYVKKWFMLCKRECLCLNIGRSTLVGQCPVKSSPPSVPLSVCPSVTKFSQDWINSFFLYCTWWQLTMISSDWRNQIFKNKFWRPELGPTGQNRTWIEVFCYFLKFGLLVFLEIAYSENLKQKMSDI